MTAIPILSGIVSDGNAEFRNAYPVNLIPVPKQSGISQGYLRPADGIALKGTGPGVDRGGINWNGLLYRVMGGDVCSIDAAGNVTSLGSVAGNERVKFAYSFDRLAIVAGGNAYYLAGSFLSQLTDPDLGTVIDVIFVDGYFMFTDGVNLIVTELSDATAINPLKYGSAESDPDPVQGLIKLRNEVNAIGRYTIQVFDNVGGDVFPFATIEGALINRGSMGVNTHCLFGVNAIAFLGSGLNESPSIYLAANSAAARIATREVETLLQSYSEAQLATASLESRFDKGHQHLYVHLTDRTLVYDAAASAAAEEPVWFVLTSAIQDFLPYRARNLVWIYDGWQCGDPLTARIGTLTNEVSSHYGEQIRWEFSTVIIYNEGASGIIHELELVALTGRTAFGIEPLISTSYSKDGVSWSQDKSIRVGARGQRDKRLMWRQQGTIGHFRVQRFTGDSQSFASFAKLEVQIEPLAYATR